MLQSAKAHASTVDKELSEELSKLADLHTEMAELKEEQLNMLIYKEFCEIKHSFKSLAESYEKMGNPLRAGAIMRSVPAPPELLDYLKRRHVRKYFEEVIWARPISTKPCLYMDRAGWSMTKI